MAFNIRAWLKDEVQSGPVMYAGKLLEVKDAVSPLAHRRMSYVDFGEDTQTLLGLHRRFDHCTVFGLVPASFRRGIYRHFDTQGTIEVCMKGHVFELVIMGYDIGSVLELLSSMKRGETKHLVEDWSGEKPAKKPADAAAAEADSSKDMRVLMASAITNAQSVEVVRFLVMMGADINAPFGKSKMTPLIGATKDRVPDVVKFLLEKGADPNFIDAEGMTALDHLPLPAKAGMPMPIDDSTYIAYMLLLQGAKPVTERWKNFEGLDKLRKIYGQTGPGCGG